MRTATRIALLLLFVLGACDRGRMADIEAVHPKYKPGQVWAYKTRAGEDGSRVTILRVDKHPANGEYIVHISVDGLAIKSLSAPDGVARTISHLPFAEDAMSTSLVRVERMGPVPDFQEGYQTWRRSFDRAQAGVWSVSIADAISAMETALQQTN